MIVGLANCGLRTILKPQSAKVSLSTIRYARTQARARMQQTIKTPKFASGASGNN